MNSNPTELPKAQLILPEELSNLLKQESPNSKLRIIEASFGESDDYKKSRIPGARLLNLYKVNVAINKPSQLASKTAGLISCMKELDVGKNDKIVCYCRGPVYASTKAWWELVFFGCKDVSILNGGFEQYQSQGFLIEKGDEFSWKQTKKLDRT